MENGTEEPKRKKEEKCKIYNKGSFLRAGSINNPENSYHLEIVVSSREMIDGLGKRKVIYREILPAQRSNERMGLSGVSDEESKAEKWFYYLKLEKFR